MIKPNPTDPAGEAFAQVFGDLLEKYNLTIDQLVTHTGMSGEQISAMIEGTRPPTRSVSFYSALREKAGFKKEDVAILLRSSDFPRWLIRDNESSEIIEDQKGVTVEIRLHIPQGAAAGDRLGEQFIDSLLDALMKRISGASVGDGPTG